jgi:hypothetical protein
MSDSQIGGLLIILLAVAYWIYRYIKKRNDNAKAEPLRAELNAAKDNYFSKAVELLRPRKEYTNDMALEAPEEIDINRRVEFERKGRSFLLAAKTLEAVIEQPTKAEMIALMKRYVSEFGHDAAEQAKLYNHTAGDREKEQIETKREFVVRILNEILSESKDDQQGRAASIVGRSIGIWVFGLLASAIVGGILASRLTPPYESDWGVWGALAGTFAFACLRWLGAPKKI